MSLNPDQADIASPPPDQRLDSACSCGCRSRLRRYPSDTTDDQWAVLQPLLPTPACATRAGGRPETHHRRAIIDAIFYIVDNGAKWRAMPADLPPWRTVYGFFARWSADLTTTELTDRLRERVRLSHHRSPRPTAGCIDAQSVHESAEGVVGRASSGYDHYKRVNGRKRHIVTDTLGLLVAVIATPANTQDRDAAADLLHHIVPHGIRHLWADNGYHGDWITTAAGMGITIDIVARPSGGKGFQIQPRRWVVERTLAWITRRRRCARDYERLTDHHEACVYWAAIIQLSRRQANHQHTNPKSVQKQPL